MKRVYMLDLPIHVRLLVTLGFSLFSACYCGVVQLSTEVPAADHAGLANTGTEYSRITSGGTCEANAGWESIHSVSECMLATNYHRCFLSVSSATCGPGHGTPCGCSYDTGSRDFLHATWAGVDYTDAEGCSTTKNCVCRSPVDGSYSIVSTGDSCCDHGLEAIEGPMECEKAGNLLNLRGAGDIYGKCERIIKVHSNPNPNTDCFGENRGPKCANWQFNNNEYPGYSSYLVENYTTDNPSPASCAYPFPLGCGHASAHCLCKRSGDPTDPGRSLVSLCPVSKTPSASPSATPSASPSASPSSSPSYVKKKLCYKMAYHCTRGSACENFRTVYPVDGFPENHAKVNYEVCGEKVAAGSPIPHGSVNCPNCRWDQGGESNHSLCSTITDCIEPPYSTCSNNNRGELNGGTIFYAYNYPKRASSNTGYEEVDAITVYYVIDDAESVWFVMNIDKPNNNLGGSLRMEIDGTGLENSYIVAMDDPRTVRTDPDYCRNLIFSNTLTDCAAWNPQLGHGSFKWAYQDCCTDGLVIGPMPKKDFTMRLNFPFMGTQDFIEGTTALNKLRLGSYIGDTNSIMSFETILPEDFYNYSGNALYEGIEVQGFDCDGYCGSIDNCGQCSASTDCGWCGGTCRWIDSTDYDSSQCIHNQCCPVCSSLDSAGCEGCTNEPGCGWCEGERKCISVGAGGSNELCTSCNSSFHHNEATCPSSTASSSKSLSQTPTWSSTSSGSPSESPSPSATLSNTNITAGENQDDSEEEDSCSTMVLPPSIGLCTVAMEGSALGGASLLVLGAAMMMRRCTKKKVPPPPPMKTKPPPRPQGASNPTVTLPVIEPNEGGFTMPNTNNASEGLHRGSSGLHRGSSAASEVEYQAGHNEIISSESTIDDEWIRAEMDDGNAYWYNEKTGETSWTNPAFNTDSFVTDGEVSPEEGPSVDGIVYGAGKWDAAIDSEGQTYYYNIKTNETAWELPEGARIATHTPPSLANLSKNLTSSFSTSLKKLASWGSGRGSTNGSMRKQRLGSVAPSEADEVEDDKSTPPMMEKKKKERSWVVAAGGYIGFGGKKVDVNWKGVAPESAPHEYDDRRRGTPRYTKSGSGQRTRVTVTAKEAKKKRVPPPL